MSVNQSLALTQIGNKYPRAHKTIMTGLRWKWIPALTLYNAFLFSRPRGSCHGKQLSLDASWQPDSIASAISPLPRAFSRQIASSTLKSNLLPTVGFYQRNRWFPLFPWTMQREGRYRAAQKRGVLIFQALNSNRSISPNSNLCKAAEEEVVGWGVVGLPFSSVIGSVIISVMCNLSWCGDLDEGSLDELLDFSLSLSHSGFIQIQQISALWNFLTGMPK